MEKIYGILLVFYLIGVIINLTIFAVSREHLNWPYYKLMLKSYKFAFMWPIAIFFDNRIVS